ncbi:MAG: protein-glutamate O-methyltransferase [Nitrospirae bacterium]|nr:protein-glutamate O-methyltransferase [Nitrospirota bacterium]
MEYITEESQSAIANAVMSDKDFLRLKGFICDECGIRLTDAKKIMLESRLRRRLRKLGMHSFREYCDYLFSPKGAAGEIFQMIDEVTTNKTDFFREPNHFDYLVRRALPEITGGQGDCARKRLMVWSAGCSTGEEPYTLAMILSDYTERLKGLTFEILATDISTKVLEKAMSGIYDEERVEPVPVPFKRKYLLRSKDRSRALVRIVPELRDRVKFRRLNFMAGDFGMREQMDVIFCRNVIIYFDRPTQEMILNRICHHLARGGYLFMGHSETLSGLDVPLTQVAPTVYRKADRH